MAEKNDVFVGNLTFNTTEEQLREKFSFVGPVKNIRILTDKDTGKTKGFAFVEYFDTNTALLAIRHLDQTELNNRKIKVGYPAQSNLKDIARQIGSVVPSSLVESQSLINTTTTIDSLVSGMKLHELWDLFDAMKRLVCDSSVSKDKLKLKLLLETHPQLVLGLCEIQKRLGVVLPNNLQQQQQQVEEEKEELFHKTTSSSRRINQNNSTVRTEDNVFAIQQQQQLLIQQQQQYQNQTTTNDQFFYSQNFSDNYNNNNNYNNNISMNNNNINNNFNNNFNNNNNMWSMPQDSDLSINPFISAPVDLSINPFISAPVDLSINPFLSAQVDSRNKKTTGRIQQQQQQF